MCKNKIQKWIAIALGVVSLLGLGYLTLSPILNRTAPYTQEQVINQQDKLLTKDTVVKEINNISEITTLNITSNKNAKIETKGSLGIGTKSKEIIFETNTKFTFDLSKLESENIVVLEDRILIFISEPTVNTTINNDNTKYKATDNSLMSFGELKLSPESVGEIESKVIAQVNLDSSSGANLQQAKDNLRYTLIDTIGNLTNHIYSIEINYVR